MSFSGSEFPASYLQANINNKNLKLNLINPDNSGTPMSAPVPKPNTISGTFDSDSQNGSTGDDEIFGQEGNDLLFGGAGDDFIDGGEDVDTAHYIGLFVNYSIDKIGNNFAVIANHGTDGSDFIINVERLQFADTQLALDLGGHAGTTSKILGVVFGVASVSNEEFVGIGLQLLDDGMSVQDLVQLALNAKLGAGFSDVNEVNLLYSNLVGSLPDTDALNFWAGKLREGEFTQNSLAVMASELDLNANNINLVGLSQTGIEFL